MEWLKNCPFCDVRARWMCVDSHKDLITIICPKCGLHTCIGENVAEVTDDMIRIWNNRTEERKEKDGIKACPCCGKDVDNIEVTDPWGNKTYKIECDCDIFTEPYNTKEELLGIWNK